MNAKKIVSISTGIALVAVVAMGLPALAETNSNTQGSQSSPQKMMNKENRSGMRPAVVGKVTAVNGNSITVDTYLGRASTTTSYVVDATNATVKKNNATSSVSNITVGDLILVQGTVSGTNVVATNIRDNVPGSRPADKEGRKGKMTSSSLQTLQATGNGQPVVAGKISAISGSTLTVTNPSNVTYTVDASSSKILSGSNSITFSNLVVGDTVLIQGVVNGTSITASTIIDQGSSAGATNQTDNAQTSQKPTRGFLGGISQFFMHLFGF